MIKINDDTTVKDNFINLDHHITRFLPWIKLLVLAFFFLPGITFLALDLEVVLTFLAIFFFLSKK